MTGSTLQIACALGLGTALLILPAWGQERPARGRPFCPQETWPDRLQEIDAQGDLVMALGRIAKLADIRIPDDAPRREEVLAWLRKRLGQPILAQGGESLDRWGRVSIRIRLAHEANPLDLGQGLVEAGLALVDPAPAESFCQPELLALEETARERSLGLWTDDRYKPIDVALTDSLRDRVGSFVLVEGRIRSVGERAQQTYLNFGGNWAEDFTIVIPHRIWKLMAGRGLGAEALRGRRIRA
jgi:endonuclease YncB( thermonuclease family)